MAIPPRTVVRVTCVAAFLVFCGVQDRITAAAARQYVARQRSALASGGEPVSIDSVMRPAASRSVRRGLLWAGIVGAAGLAAAAVSTRRSR